ncbi:MAG: Rne/Rng family ribonuclease [Propionibacteriaceae bacterium]|jgi:ribonuclease E|nr:Rne/Rng family ribonuclease [Propionibacteriaceae bacterium]
MLDENNDHTLDTSPADPPVSDNEQPALDLSVGLTDQDPPEGADAPAVANDPTAVAEINQPSLGIPEEVASAASATHRRTFSPKGATKKTTSRRRAASHGSTADEQGTVDGGSSAAVEVEALVEALEASELLAQALDAPASDPRIPQDDLTELELAETEVEDQVGSLLEAAALESMIDPVGGADQSSVDTEASAPEEVGWVLVEPLPAKVQSLALPAVVAQEVSLDSTGDPATSTQTNADELDPAVTQTEADGASVSAATTASGSEPKTVTGRRRRNGRGASRQSSSNDTEAATSTLEAETDDPIGVALSALGRSRRRRPVNDEPVEAEAQHSGDDKSDALDSLAHAIAETVAEANDDADEGNASASRRRRRRGGRKRHRDVNPTEVDDTLEESEVDPIDDDAQVSSDDDANEDNARHHRRRRRRRGESVVDEESDDVEVTVKVRDPHGRSLRGKSSAVTGIDGSTRLEAKKQRRREGRAASRQRVPILSEAEFLARRESVERKMLIRQKDDYSQIAVVEDNMLVEHYVDRASATSLIGNIYLGKVQNVLPGMEAAFIDIGRVRTAVLYAGEVDWDSFGDKSQNRKIEEVFSPGQMVVVQVSKDPVGAKGARLTSHISIPGRYVVYAPAGHISGISRRLSDAERHRLKSILDGIVGETASVVIRTAAEGATEEELVNDINRLKAQWEVVEKKVGSKQTPQLLYSEPDLTMRIVRDLFTEDFTSLIVDGNGGLEDAFDTAEAYVKHVAPHLADRIQRWDRGADGDLFARFRIDEQIAKALDRKVHLPSGGSLVIDRTEAMTVIDVNTGKFTGSGGNLEATVTSNNLEAAEEIVRQLRLRDIGGIIIVDFIDMVLPSNRELLLRRLVECLGRDRTRHQVSEVTSLGLVQLTRKKVGTGLAEAFTKPCEACHGLGYIRFDEPIDSQAPADGGERHTNRHGGRRRPTAH